MDFNPRTCGPKSFGPTNWTSRKLHNQLRANIRPTNRKLGGAIASLRSKKGGLCSTVPHLVWLDLPVYVSPSYRTSNNMVTIMEGVGARRAVPFYS